MKLNITVTAVACIVLFAASCKKDPVPAPPPPPPAKPVVAVKLSDPYLSIAQVDSAFATWTIPGGQTQRFKMQVGHDSLLVDRALFTDGQGKLTIEIFSNKKLNNQYLTRFVLTRNIALAHVGVNAFAGPKNFFDPDWLPRVELKDAIGHEAIVALRPEDPYFLIKDSKHAIVGWALDRNYSKGINVIAGKVWTCTSGCTNKENVDFFTNFPQQIGAKEWKHISITVIYEIDHTGQAWMLNLEYEP